MAKQVRPMMAQIRSKIRITLIALLSDILLVFNQYGTLYMLDLEISKALVGFKTLTPDDLIGGCDFYKFFRVDPLLFLVPD